MQRRVAQAVEPLRVPAWPYPGAVALVETNRERQREDWHVFESLVLARQRAHARCSADARQGQRTNVRGRCVSDRASGGRVCVAQDWLSVETACLRGDQARCRASAPHEPRRVVLQSPSTHQRRHESAACCQTNAAGEATTGPVIHSATIPRASANLNMMSGLGRTRAAFTVIGAIRRDLSATSATQGSVR